MPHTLQFFREQFAPHNKNPATVELLQPELNGGITSTEEIARLADYPQATRLRISGLDQGAFEYFVQRFPNRFEAVYFWKCPKIHDLTPIQDLKSVTHLIFYHNQRATRLWNFRETPNLAGLRFDDFSKLRALDDLRDATSLRELQFGNAIWTKAMFQSLDPIMSLQQLRSLQFNAKAIVDGRIQPLSQLVNLEILEFSPKLFTQRQIAWLRAKLPPSVASETLNAYRAVPAIPTKSGKVKDVLFNGTGMRFFDSSKDKKKVEELSRLFDDMVRYFKERPYEDPDAAQLETQLT